MKVTTDQAILNQPEETHLCDIISPEAPASLYALTVFRFRHVVVEPRMSLNFGKEEQRSEEAHEWNAAQSVCRLLPRLILKECIVLPDTL